MPSPASRLLQMSARRSPTVRRENGDQAGRSRLKPVQRGARSVGLALAGKRPARTTYICGVTPDAFPAKAGPTKCAVCRTGFSREEARENTIHLRCHA